MTNFDIKINNCSKLDWRILMDGSVSLYHNADILKKDIQWLKNAGYQVYELDFSVVKTREEFHKIIKRMLNFPEYYGENMPAFSDCLMNDVPISENEGVAISLKKFDEYYQRDEEYAHEILERLELNSRRWILFGNRFLTLVQINNKDIVIKEIGQHPLVWNLYEQQ